MAEEITIYIDYVCPYCLLADKLVRKAIDGKGIRIRWRPFELRPHPMPTLRVEDDYLPRIWRTSVYPMANRLGVPIVLPQISPQPRTDKAFEVFAFAEERGLGDKFTMRTLRAFFQEEQDIGQINVLASLAQEIGLDHDDVQQALLSGTFTQTHREALKYAREEAGITAVPTLIIGDQRIEGVPKLEQLQAAVNAHEGNALQV